MRKKRGYELAFYLAGFVLGSAAITLLHYNPLVLTSVLLAGSLLLLAYKPQKGDVYFYAIAAVISLHEVVVINFGAWKYANPSFLGIPLWLPFMYGLIAVVIKRIAHLYA